MATKFTQQLSPAWNVEKAGQTTTKYIAFYSSDDEQLKGKVGVSVTDYSVRRAGAMGVKGRPGFAANPRGPGAVAAPPKMPPSDQIIWADTEDAALQVARDRIANDGGTVKK